jgi:hypothetical protein
MGLRSDIQADLAAAYDTDLADAVTPFTGSRVVTSGTYDPATGGYTSTTLTYSGRGVMGGFKAMEIDNQNIYATDVKLSGVLQNELIDSEGAAVEPQVDDTIADMKVVSVGKDPAQATFTVQLRRT